MLASQPSRKSAIAATSGNAGVEATVIATSAAAVKAVGYR
jgi:hypothetical protein